MTYRFRMSLFLAPMVLVSTLGATSITVTRDSLGTPCGVPLQGDCSTQAGAITVDFNSAFNNASGNYSAGIATYVWDSQRSSPIVQGSTPVYAEPGQGSNLTPFLTVGSPGRPATVTINLSSPISYFGLFMGSPDTFNSISFFEGGSLIRQFSGDSSLLNSPNVVLGSWDVTNYLNFYIEGGTVDKIVLGSTSAAFETDNHAFVPAPVTTPEPSTMLTLGLGGIIFIAGRGRILRRKKTS